MTRFQNVLLRTGVVALALLLTNFAQAASRAVHAQNMTVARGETNRLFVSFDTLGDEYAVVFTLCFDTNQLAFVGAVRGSSVSNMVPTPGYTPNFNRASNGVVSVLINLNIQTEQTWPPGTQNIMEFLFRALPGGGSTTTPISFCAAGSSEVSNPFGDVLPASFIDAMVTIQGTCAYNLSTNAASVSDAANSGSVNVLADPGCVWSVTNTNTWITITAGGNGTGNGTVSYSVDANTGFTSRTGVVVIAGKSFTITQAGFVCTYLLFSTEGVHDHGAETNAIDLATADNCAWTITNTNSWITILSPTNNSGSGAMMYAVVANDTSLMRTGIVMLAGQPVTIVQFGAPCVFDVSPLSANFGSAISTGQVSVVSPIGCEWQAFTVDDWISVSSLVHTTGTILTYTLAANTALTPRTGSIFVADQTLEIVQQGATCQFTLSASNRTHIAAASTNAIDVTTLDGCTWNVATTNDWVAIQSPIQNTSSGTVTYTLTDNNSPTDRVAFVTVADQTLVITQRTFVCTYAVSPTNTTRPSSSSTNIVSVTAAAGCIWSASKNAGWITMLPLTNNNGNGTLTYIVNSNPSSLARTGLVTIAGRTLTVVQLGVPCDFSLSPTDIVATADEELQQVDLYGPDGCVWTISNTNTWITMDLFQNRVSGTGSASFLYRVDANPAGISRTGRVQIANQVLTVIQQAACIYALATNNASFSSAAQNNTVFVTAVADCSWTVSTATPWISILSSTNNTNSGTVNFAVATNTTVSARVGLIRIAGQDFAVTQAPGSCSVSLPWSNWVHRASSETGLVGVISVTGCSWGVTNTNNWISINATSGDGNGHVGYTLAANNSPNSRSGVLNISGAPFAITQLGTACTYRLSTTNRIHGNGANANTITLTVGAGCSWSVINTNPWITILSNSFGSGTTTIGYGFTKNTNTLLRSGVINIGGEILYITQWSTNCGFALTPVGREHGFGPEAGSVKIDAAIATCVWNVANPTPWITIPPASMTGTGAVTITYNLLTNVNGQPRTGTFTVSGVPFTVIQAGSPCSFALSTNNASFSATTGNGSVTVTTGDGCAWDVVNTNSWISISSPLTIISSGSVSYTVDANPAGLARAGVITIAGQSFTVTQAAEQCVFTLTTNNAVHGYAPTGGSVALSTLVGCAWGVTNTNTWISFPITSTTNSGALTYNVLTNALITARTGVVNVANQTFTIVQVGAPCSFAIGTNFTSHSNGPTTGSVAVATANGCIWLVSSGAPWINILSGLAGTNTGLLTYSVNTNPTVFMRTGVVTVAGQTLTVVQAGAPCGFSLSQSNAVHGFATSTGSVSVFATAGCNWTATSLDSWITVTSATNGLVAYAVATNSGTLRSGTVTIANIPFRITQAGSQRALRAINMSVAHGETNRVLVALEATGIENAVGFTVCFNTNQLSFVRGTGGSAATNLGASLNVNGSLSAQGQVAVSFALSGGQVMPAESNAIVEIFFRAAAGTTFTNTIVSLCDAFLEREVSDVNGSTLPATYSDSTVTILGDCNYSVTPTSLNFPANGGGDSVGVTAHSSCAWAASSGASWIHITPPTNGSGSTAVIFSVDANPTASPRSGTITIAGQTVTVTQDAQTCTYSLSPISRSHAFVPGTGSIHVTALAGCAWTVNTANSWITITSSTNGSGEADVFYSVASNSVAVARTGVIDIAGQSFTIFQDGAPCVVTLIGTTNKLHGFISETGSVIVTSPSGCDWTINNTNVWVVFPSGTNGTGSNVVNYLVGYNPNGVARTGTVFIASRPYTMRQPANSCPVTLAPGSGNHGPNWATNTFTIMPGSSCAWTAVNSNSWITLSSTNGTGNGSITYIAQPNPVGSIRIGVITVSGREFVITQAAATCFFTLNPPGGSYGAGADIGSIVLNTTPACDWSVQNTNTWLSFTTPTTGTGNATLSYNIAANPGSVGRSGNVVIGNQIFPISQAATPCTTTLSSTSTNFSFGAQTGTVAVSTPAACGWNVSTTNSWIGLATNRFTNSAIVTFTVASNATGLTRVGYILIEDQVFTVTQSGVPCVYTISPTNTTRPSSSTTNIVSITAAAGCDWSGSSSAGWITMLPGTNSSGNGTLTYIVNSNPSSLARTGTVTIAGQKLTVVQFGVPCDFSLSPTGIVATADEELQQVDLYGPDGCVWTISNTNTWITMDLFQNRVSGTGSASFLYRVDANTAGISRTGRVQIANQILTVTQPGQPCSFTLASSNAFVASIPTTNTVDVGTQTGCNWGASTTNSWIQILAGSTNSGNGIVRYAVATNFLSTARTGMVTIAGQQFIVTQAGASCSYSLIPTSDILTSGNVTGLVRIVTTGNCTWAAVKTNSWIAIKSGGEGTNGGLLRYTLAQNDSPNTRVGYLTIADQVFTVTQQGSPCVYNLSSTGRLHGSLFDTGQVSVVAVSECSWTIDNTNAWIQFQSPTNGAGTAVITYTVQQNPNSVDRTGRFIIGDQIYTVTQLGSVCSYTLDSIGATHGGLPETNLFGVNTLSGCTWTVSETNTWISILSGSTGTNNTAVFYSVSLNVSGAARTGVIRVGGQPFTVTQAPVACSFNVVPGSFNHGFEAETNSISITTSNVCPWVVSKTNSWINIATNTIQTGSTNISFFVSANPSSTVRTGVVMVAGQPVTIRQAGLVCSYGITPQFYAHGYREETNQISVSCPSLCTWGVGNTNSWVHIITATNNVGPGIMRYWLNANPTTSTRSANINVDGQVFTISQNGMPFIIASNKTVQCNSTWNFDPPAVSGTCVTPGSANVFITSTSTNPGCGLSYMAKRIWDATDACGVHITATQTVTVVSPAPIITCAQDKNVECGAVWTFNAPTAVEFCGGASASIRVVSTLTNSIGMCSNTYAVTRTWEATDSCSNKSTCSQTVRIVDTTPPVVTCASNKTVECASVWIFDAPTATDSCGGSNVTIRVLSGATNSSANCGLIATRIWEILDLCSNLITCTQTVNAVDTTPPSMTCPLAKTVECGTLWNFDPPTASDTCSGVTLFVLGTATNSASSCGNTFTATRTWQAIDGCGNVNFCSQTVVMIDTTPPVVSTVSDKTVEFGQAWDFDAPTGTDSCSGTNVSIRIVATSTNKAGFCGPTFTATRIWEVADGCTNKVTRVQTVTVRDTTPPVMNCAANKVINCQSAWSFDTPTAIDQPSGVAATVTVVSTLTNGICGTNYSATRTWIATDLCSNTVTCSQTVFGRALVNVSGTIYVPTNFPAVLSDKRVAGATILAPTNATSAQDGSYVCTFDAITTNVVLAPVPPDTGIPSAGVSTIDLSLIRRHILSVVPLDTPYKLLAADVDGSGTISTLDLTSMRRVILGSTNRFPRGLWRFLPSDFSFPNAQAPWTAPTNRVYQNVANDMTGQDFIGIKLGDVDNSWSAGGSGGGGGNGGVSGPHSGQTTKPIVTFTVSNVSTLPETSAVIHVKAAGFQRVTSIQGTLNWDPGVIRFTGTEQFGVAGMSGSSFGIALTTNGSVSFSWDDPTSGGTTLADGTVVFALRFDVVGSLGSRSRVAVVDSVTVREVGVDFTPAIFQTVDGQLSVTDPSATQVSYQTQGATHGVTVPTVVGKNYILEFSDVIPGTNWTALPTVSGDGEIKTLSDPNPASPQRFYRVRIE